MHFVFRRTGRAGNHGFAYTFISPDQGKYAGELIKALELSAASVPNELLILWEKYKQEAEAVSYAEIHKSLSFNLATVFLILNFV